ncbi:terpene synthase family protein [Colletotrichum cereale]|nr:terpene synthase family protein [Colletotrichum cereale]
MSSSLAQTPITLQPTLRRPEANYPVVQEPTRGQIIQQLHGQTVRIPDLAKLMIDWSKDMSPHVQAVNSKILESIEIHAVNETVRMRLTKAMLSEQLAGWYPYASCDRIKALTSFQVWMFIIDDMLDQYSLVHKFDFKALDMMLTDCQDFIERSLGVSTAAETSTMKYQDHNAVVSFEEYAKAACLYYSDNYSYRTRIASEVTATLNGYRQEALNRHTGRVPSLDEYLSYREASSCIMQVVVNLEFANGISLPEEVMASAEMQKLYHATVTVLWIFNDIVSVRKEIKEGFIENLVVLLANGNMQQGLDATVARLEHEVAAVNEACEAAIARFADTPHQDHVLLLVKNCKNMCMANWFWSLKTPRYCLWDIESDSEGGFTFTVDAQTEEL